MRRIDDYLAVCGPVGIGIVSLGCLKPLRFGVALVGPPPLLMQGGKAKQLDDEARVLGFTHVATLLKE
jgi:hypothetical protein